MEKDIKTHESIEIQENNEKKVNFSFKELLFIFISGIFLGLLQNYLMYSFKGNGFGSTLFSFIYLGVLLLVSFKIKIPLNKNIYIVAISIIIFSSFKSIRIGLFLNFFNNIVLVFLHLLLLTILIKQRFENIKLTDYIAGYVKIYFGSIFGIFIWFKDLFLTKFSFTKDTSSVKIHIFKGILMAIPLIYIFTSLFASSDLIFGDIIKSFINFDIFRNIEWNLKVINIILFSGIFIGCFSFIGYVYRSTKKIVDEKEVLYDNKKHIEINILLGLILILFSFFVILQINYLFTGEQSMLLQGYTYSDYARKGFYELIISAFLVFLVLWKIDDYLYYHKKISDNEIYKYLSTGLIILTIIILFSSFYRLWLYEKAYGLTEIRFYSYILIIILLLSLCLFLVKIFKFIKEGHFIITIFSLYIFSLFICNLINPESFITTHNINRNYSGERKVDFSYIQERGTDAVDNILASYNSLNGEEKKSKKREICKIFEIVNDRNKDWREFNYSYYHAYKAILPYKDELNCNNYFNLYELNGKGLQEYINKNGIDEVVFLYEGENLYGNLRYQDAIEKYNKGLKINPKMEGLYLGLGKSYMKLNDNNKSFEELSKGLQICDEKCEDFYSYMGEIKFDEENYNEAIKYYEKSSQKEDRVNIGISYYLLNNYNKSIEILLPISNYGYYSTDFNKFLLYYNLGMSYFKINDYKNALVYIDKASDMKLNDDDIKKLEEEMKYMKEAKNEIAKKEKK